MLLVGALVVFQLATHIIAEMGCQIVTPTTVTRGSRRSMPSSNVMVVQLLSATLRTLHTTVRKGARGVDMGPQHSPEHPSSADG